MMAAAVGSVACSFSVRRLRVGRVLSDRAGGDSKDQVVAVAAVAGGVLGPDVRVRLRPCCRRSESILLGVGTVADVAAVSGVGARGA